MSCATFTSWFLGFTCLVFFVDASDVYWHLIVKKRKKIKWCFTHFVVDIVLMKIVRRFHYLILWPKKCNVQQNWNTPSGAVVCFLKVRVINMVIHVMYWPIFTPNSLSISFVKVVLWIHHAWFLLFNVG